MTAAPDFTVQAAIGGKDFSFSFAESLQKGSVVLYFYPKSFTPGCMIEAHEFAEAIDSFAAARRAGAEVVVSPFPDAIGSDAVIRWPGGVNMRLYWHTTAPSYVPLVTVPENRVYVSSDRADAFVHAVFSGGRVVADDLEAPGVEIGRPSDTYRRVRLESTFGKMTVLVTNGRLPWPYGRELTGNEVANMAETLAKAKAAGVDVLAGPYSSNGRDAVMVQFPGGYIADIHARRLR